MKGSLAHFKETERLEVLVNSSFIYTADNIEQSVLLSLLSLTIPRFADTLTL